MKHPKILQRLRPIKQMLAMPLSSVVLPPIVDQTSSAQALLVQQVAEQFGLNLYEELLLLAMSFALGVELAHTAQMCLLSRVTDAEIEAHARELGVAGVLKRSMIETIRKFGQCMQLLQHMQVVVFMHPIAGRTLLGYETMEVRDGPDWHAVLDALCGEGKCFQSKAVVYDNFLMYGLAQKKGYKFMRPTNEVHINSTQKKIATLMYSRVFHFRQKTLAKNLARYTNNHEAADNLQSAVFHANIVQMLLDGAKKLDV